MGAGAQPPQLGFFKMGNQVPHEGSFGPQAGAGAQLICGLGQGNDGRLGKHFAGDGKLGKQSLGAGKLGKQSLGAGKLGRQSLGEGKHLDGAGKQGACADGRHLATGAGHGKQGACAEGRALPGTCSPLKPTVLKAMHKIILVIRESSIGTDV